MNTTPSQRPATQGLTVMAAAALALLVSSCTGEPTASGPHAMVEPSSRCAYTFEKAVSGVKVLRTNDTRLLVLDAEEWAKDLNPAEPVAGTTFTVAQARVTCADIAAIEIGEVAAFRDDGGRSLPRLHVRDRGEWLYDMPKSPEGWDQRTIYLAFLVPPGERVLGVDQKGATQFRAEIATLTQPAVGGEYTIPVEDAFASMSRLPG